MKLADAENLLALRKRQGPITERWSTETDEGIVLECWPAGFARGSIGIQDMFSMIPHAQYSALFAGRGKPHHVQSWHHRPGRLWPQEAYVYYLELRAAARKALANIDRASFLPRVGEERGKTSSITNDPVARPEDFRLFWQPPLAFESVEACLTFLTKAKETHKWQKENSSNTRSSITRNKRKTKPKETNGPSQLSSLIQKWSSLPVKPKLPCLPHAQLSWEIT